jgi:hypothetical protein
MFTTYRSPGSRTYRYAPSVLTTLVLATLPLAALVAAAHPVLTLAALLGALAASLYARL